MGKMEAGLAEKAPAQRGLEQRGVAAPRDQPRDLEC